MRCLVVGAGGFVGRAASAVLKADGHEVMEVLGSPQQAMPAGAYVYAAGIYRQLSARIRETDLVVYAAGRSLPRGALGRDAAIGIDCGPFNDLLEALAGSSHPATVLLISSAGAVYGETPPGVHLAEDAPTRPVSTYGVTRLLMEESLRSHAGSNGTRGVVFRVSNLYGPGQAAGRGSGFILNLLLAAKRGNAFNLLGSGRQRKDFLYIDDLAQAIRCVPGHVSAKAGEALAFNICAGVSHSLLEVMAAVERVIGKTVFVVRVDSHVEDVQHVQLSNARAVAGLGWTNRVSLHEGIARTWAWVNESA